MDREPFDGRFPKSARVVHQADFDRVFKTGAYLADATLVMHACKNGLGVTRIGLSISKRVGNAVVRNRWKRQIREAFRTQRQQLPIGLDIVVRPRKDSELDHDAIAASILKLTRQITKKF